MVIMALRGFPEDRYECREEKQLDVPAPDPIQEWSPQEHQRHRPPGDRQSTTDPDANEDFDDQPRPAHRHLGQYGERCEERQDEWRIEEWRK